MSRTNEFPFPIPYNDSPGQPCNFTELTMPLQSFRIPDLGDILRCSSFRAALPFSFASENLRNHDNSPCTTGPYDTSLATHPLEPLASPESMSISPGGDSYYSPLSLSPLILSSNLSYDSPLTSTSSLDDLRSESTGSIPRLIKPKVTRTGTTLQVLKLLQDARLNVLDLLKLTLAGEGDFASQWKALFSPKNRVLLQEVLVGIFGDEKGA